MKELSSIEHFLDQFQEKVFENATPEVFETILQLSAKQFVDIRKKFALRFPKEYEEWMVRVNIKKTS